MQSGIKKVFIKFYKISAEDPIIRIDSLITCFIFFQFFSLLIFSTFNFIFIADFQIWPFEIEFKFYKSFFRHLSPCQQQLPNVLHGESAVFQQKYHELQQALLVKDEHIQVIKNFASKYFIHIFIIYIVYIFLFIIVR